jgi:predicted outer membrane lipoprotein
MGPGYFPLLLGILLAILGAFTVFYSLVEHTEDGDKVGKFVWRPIVYVLGANVAFGILLAGLPSLGVPAMGLIVAIFALVIIASRAGDRFNLKEVLILATVLSVGSYMAFIMLLKLQMPVWPTFITG